MMNPMFGPPAQNLMVQALRQQGPYIGGGLPQLPQDSSQDIAAQLALNEQRYRPNPEMISAGRMQVAPSPLSYAGRALGNIATMRRGGRLQKGLEEARKKEREYQSAVSSAERAEDLRRFEAKLDVQKTAEERKVLALENTLRHQQEMERLAQERLEESRIPKPSATEKQQMTGMVGLLGQIDEINRLREDLTPEQQEQADSPYKSAAMSAMPNAVQRLAEERAYDAPVRQYLTNLSFMENEISRMMSGLAVTGFEMAARQAWSPGAPGISQEERQNRLDSIENIFQNRYGDLSKLYPRFARRYEGTIGGSDTGYTGVSGAEVAEPETRAVNPQTGEVLVLRNGQWVPE